MQIERNYGIDLMKIASMFMVVVLHILGHGGILESCVNMSLNYNIAWLLETLCYCCVNCFAMVSGYLMIKGKFNFKRIFGLWAQVIFYTVLFLIIFKIVWPSNVHGKDFIKSIFPTISSHYWYFTSYVLVFFMAPFYNKFILSSDKKTDTYVFVVLAVFLSILPTISLRDIYKTNYGSSFLWLSFMYLIGAYINKYSLYKNIKKATAVKAYLFLCIISWLSKILIPIAANKLLHASTEGRLFIACSSPTIMFAAASLFIAFLNIDIHSDKLKSLLKILSEVSFGVYIISEYSLIKEKFMKGQFKQFSQAGGFEMIFYIIISALSIYIICSIIDYIRVKIFKAVNVEGIGDKFYIKVRAIMDKKLKKINI